MLYDVSLTCPFCFESFWIEVDPSGGPSQNWIYDCEVCCRPIEVQATWDEDAENYVVEGGRS